MEQTNFSQKELCEGLKQGNSEVLKYFYQEVKPKVRTYIVKNGGLASDVNDIFQVAIMAARMKLLENGKNIGNIENYIFTTCVREWLKANDKKEKELKELDDYTYNQEFETEEPKQNIEEEYEENNTKSKNEDLLIRNIKDFVTSKSFFATGHYWGDIDKQYEFYKNGIWENGHTEKVVNVVNSVKKGDIIFLKSSFQQGGNSILRIKAIGVVTRNQNNGHKLFVNWFQLEKHIDLPQLGTYRNAISSIKESNVIRIFEGIINELPEIFDIINTLKYSSSFESENDLDSPNPSTIAHMSNDSINGEDYLDINDDVEAFAKVITSSNFKPPLAISLFGQWGSGKSFFMNKLSEKVEELSSRQNNPSYCNGIAQIHFNAWSYIDSNLWASIVVRVFEKLNEYLQGYQENDKKKIEEEINNQLSIIKEERDLLIQSKNKTQENLSELNNKKNKLEKKISQAHQKEKEINFTEIVKNVNNQFSLSEIIQKYSNIDQSELKKIIPEKYLNNPHQLYEAIKSKKTFIKEFFKIKAILLPLGVILTFLIFFTFCVPYLNEYINFISDSVLSVIKWFSSSLIIIGTIVNRFLSVANKFKPIIHSLKEINIDYDIAISDAIFSSKKEIQDIQIEVKSLTNKVNIFNIQIAEEERKIRELEYQLNNSIYTQTLYSFINRKSESDIYKKQLGIISTIRNDFEKLSKLLLAAENENPESETKPLKRIILYIDDLDRCREEKVIEVLEAVNLIMAFPLFIVIVGVDPRWVKNALYKQYVSQFGHTDDNNYTTIDASNYLEKIFQIPFHLKPASDNGIQFMIRQLSNIKSEIVISETSDEEQSSFEEVDNNTSLINYRNKTIQKESSDEYLAINTKEVELMQDISIFIGNNPRAIKRFVNVYHIVRAHSGLGIKKQANDNEYLTIMFLLALPMGPYKSIYSDFISYINSNKNNSHDLSDFLQTQDRIKDELLTSLSQKKSSNILKSLSIKSLKQHNNFIQRFTFSDCIK